MKIAIDLTSLYGRKRTGVEMYAIDLYRALLTTGHQLVPIFHCKNEVDENPYAYIIPQCNRLWLENVALSRAVRRVKADIVLFPVFPPPVDLLYSCKSKLFQTIHDTVSFRFRDTQNFAARYYYLPKQKLAMKRLDGIITISETVKRQLEGYTALPVYNCGEIIAPEYRDCKDKASIHHIECLDLQENGYFISVSTIEPRKNFKYLMRIVKPVLEKRNMKLVLVGRKGWGKDDELQHLIETMGNLLIFPGFVEFERLVSLYRYAYAFALLSKDEGFGRTPFEAVACGCKRIILSDIEIFHETFEGNALFVPLGNEEKAREMISQKDLPMVKEDMDVPFDVLEKRINVFLSEQS